MVFGALNSIRQTTALIANKDRRSASEEHGLDFCLATLINLSVNHRSPLLLHNINVFFSVFCALSLQMFRFIFVLRVIKTVREIIWTLRIV